MLISSAAQRARYVLSSDALRSAPWPAFKVFDVGSKTCGFGSVIQAQLNVGVCMVVDEQDMR